MGLFYESFDSLVDDICSGPIISLGGLPDALHNIYRDADGDDFGFWFCFNSRDFRPPLRKK
jgi:hypothetical protein